MTDPRNTRWPSKTTVLWAALVLSLSVTMYQAYRIWQWEQSGQMHRNDRPAPVDHRDDVHRELPMDSTSIVLFGDSHFEYFPASELLNIPNLENRGLSGQTARDLIARSAEIVQTKPRTVILCIGINDINLGLSLDDLAHDVVLLIDTLRNGSPSTRLLVLSVPPSGLAAIQTFVTSHNAWLRAACTKRGIGFLDITTPLTKDGVLDPACTYDGLHLNARGYKILADMLRTHIQGDRLGTDSSKRSL